MSPQVQFWMKTVARKFIPNPGRVLEIGALNVNGTVRQFFPDATEYIGTDMEAGDNVDLVMNNLQLNRHFGDEAFDTIIACSVLEHDLNFSWTVGAMRNMLRVGGHLIITVPGFHFPYHAFPRDYWRFSKDAYQDAFFVDMEILDLRSLDNQAGKNLVLAGIAQKGINNGNS